jgi:monofunctional biosynthetic peptidoglycan transglycosylase
MGYIRTGIKKIQLKWPHLKKLILWSTIVFFMASFILVLVLRWLPVYFTPLVFLRAGEYTLSGKWISIKKDWVNLEQISPHLRKAVIASEDPKFLSHSGFDFEAIAKAYEANKTRRNKLGASTISQQTAKNVFLYPSRTILRKGLEAYFTLLIEQLWDKRRILEVYLNVIELGPGIYGAEAAAKHYFKKSAKNLAPGEAQLFAAILPNPRKWNPKNPTSFVLRRRNFIRRNLSLLGNSYFKPTM